MSETSIGGVPRAHCELLNTPLAELLERSAGIASDRESLTRARDKMLRDHPGLAKQAGAWVKLIQEQRGSEYGPALATQAESAFTAGNLMTYELLRQIAAARGQTVPDLDFDEHHITDGMSPPDVPPEWLIDWSLRARDLPIKHPAWLDASLAMFGRLAEQPPAKLKASLFSPSVYTTVSYDLIHFIAGTAEAILPVEKQTQVEGLAR
jgi:hypothetical protein